MSSRGFSPAVYAAVFEHSLDAVFLTRPDGTVLAANRAACDLLGTTEDDICRRGRSGILDPTSPHLATMLSDRAQSGWSRAEVRYLHADGTAIPVEVSSADFTDADGEVWTVVMARDIRERIERQEQEARYRTIVDTISEGVVYQAADGTILSANPAAERIQSRESDEMVGRTSDDPQWGAIRADGSEFPGEEHPAMYTLRTGEPQEGVVMGILTPRGIRRWITINSAPVFDQRSGVPTGVVATFHDITAQKRDEDELRVSAMAFESSQVPTIITDRNGTILRVNKAFTVVTGFSAAEAIGQDPSLWASNRHSKEFFRDMRRSLADHGSWHGEVWSRRRDGEDYPSLASISAVTDSHDQITHYVASWTDLSEARKAQQHIHRLSVFDTLTGLPNRRSLLDRLENAIRESADTRAHGALIFIDVDGFTVLNETQGHTAGDALLIALARRFTILVGSRGTLARLSGDEFAIVLDDLDDDLLRAAAEVESIACDLLDVVHEPMDLDGQGYHCRASVGVALFGAGKPTRHELLKNADLALTQAKHLGGDAVQYYNRAVQAALEARVRMEWDLRRAVPDGLLLHYQPQVDADGRIYGAEALVRLVDAQGSMVSPAQFIPVAEENGLILPIGMWVLQTACRQLAVWQADSRTEGLAVSVNVSARQMHQPGFADAVAAVTSECGIDPAGLTLEITESVLINDFDSVVDQITTLAERGIRFSLDDFGTGFSSLRTLRDLPLQELKIDRSFVSAIPDDPDDIAIVRSTVALGNSLGLAVIAEGVETHEQHQKLLELGCARFQGYLFARPMPAEYLPDALGAAVN